PLVPMLLLFAGASAALPLRPPKAPGSTPQLLTGPVIGAVIAAAIFANWPMISTAMNRTVTEHNLGAALQSEGRMDEALEHYRRALAITPDYAPAYSNIGTVLQAEGHIDDAIAAYNQALAIRPGYPEVHYNLA